MRILWVKAGGLWPLTAGGRIRSFHMLRELSRRHEVSLVTTHGPGEAVPSRQILPHCESVTSIPAAPSKRGSVGFVAAVARSWLSPLPADLWRWRLPQLRGVIEQQLARGSFHLCVADFLVAMPNLPASPQVPVLLFEHNVEHLIWRRLSRSAPPWQRPVLELEWRKLRRFEARACGAAAATVTVSEPDRVTLQRLAPHAAVRAVATGVDADYFSPGQAPEEPDTIAFVGSMDWYPNEDAAVHLMESILPLIRRELPRVRLLVVGRAPSARLKKLAAGAGTEVTGTVEDVRPYLARAAVVVVPIRVGGGTRLKIFEALAMGKAVVSTSIGAEGLPVRSGEHIVLADPPEAFAREVLSLLRDAARRRALGESGRQFVLRRFSWPAVTREFEQHCRWVAAAGGEERVQLGGGSGITDPGCW